MSELNDLRMAPVVDHSKQIKFGSLPTGFSQMIIFIFKHPNLKF